ncbi:NUDIX hydrolase [Nocardia cerradoensis]|nr:NUDIX hydrolase [Nocardia cerradoensis]
MTSPNQKPAVVAVALVGPGRKTLLVKRRLAEGKLLWAFPSGEIEAGESPEDAGARECLEELGILCANLHSVASRVHPSTGRHMEYVLGELADNSPEVRLIDDEELSEFRWVSAADMDELTGGTVFGPLREALVKKMDLA